MMGRGVRWVGLFLPALVLCGAMSPAALALPENRVYEMVSPPYKGGYPVNRIFAAAPDGERFAFESLGVFDGVPSMVIGDAYLASRGASGWSTTALQPPIVITTPIGIFTTPAGVVGDFSATLEYALGGTAPGPNYGWLTESRKSTETMRLLHRTDAPNTPESWEVFGNIVMKVVDPETENGGTLERGASGDLCHVVSDDGPALLPEAVKADEPLYDLSRGCGGASPYLRLVGVKNKDGPNHEPEPIDRTCAVGFARSFAADRDNFNAISASGGEIFFTTCAGSAGSQQLFVRLGGERTLEVSRPLEPCVGEAAPHVAGEVPCKGAATRLSASFEGASEDGSKVFFTTTEKLEPATDTDTQNDLYMATIGCAGAPEGGERCGSAGEVTSLVQVSHAAEPAEVQGVVRVAPDGSHVYFVAHGVLGEGPNVEGRAPVKGADNLYVYEPDPEHEGQFKTVFVADLCSGPESSGALNEDLRCPADLEVAGTRNDTQLWLRSGPEAQSTPNGAFLVFSTYAQLLKSDADNAKDVYRYDAASGVLDRVSLGEAGHHENGNGYDEEIGVKGNKEIQADATIADGAGGGETSYRQHEMEGRAVSEDGSRIVFRTAEPLSRDAENHLQNVYEWHKQPAWSEGRVSLVSSGSSLSSDCCAVITPSGRDVFFSTSQGLVPQDIDGVNDVYDARLGGGFPPLPAERQQCSSDACQGPLTNPAPLLVPGSVPQAPGGNFAAPNGSRRGEKLTRAQQLARALKACAKRPKSRRAACRRAAQKKYAKAARSAVRRGR